MGRSDKHRQPPDLVAGDSTQPSNQPVEDETRSGVLHDGDDAAYVGEQSVVGEPNVAGGGEWPDPDAPPQAPAPGSDPDAAASIAARRQGGQHAATPDGDPPLKDAQEADPVAGGSKATPD